MNNETYDDFPFHFVLLCTAVNILIYILGAYLVSPLGRTYITIYLLYCLFVETRVLVISCRNCYYYGKLCAFGKGKVCSLFFKKGSPEKFIIKKISWLEIIPDFLVSLVPLAVGAYFSFRSFTLVRLSCIIALIIIAFPVTGFIRGSISCKFCKQKELGCPALQLFAKNDLNEQ